MASPSSLDRRAELHRVIADALAELRELDAVEPLPEMMPVKRAAFKLGCSISGLRRAASEGRLGSSEKLSPRRWLIDMTAATEWVKAIPPT